MAVPVSATADSTAGVVISKLQTGGLGSGTASQEVIELYNNSDDDINVSGWCLTYSAANDGESATTSGNGQRQLACLDAPDDTDIFLQAGSTVLLVSAKHPLADDPSVNMNFSGGMSGNSGHVRLLDHEGQEIDRVGYGAAAVRPEGTAAPAPPGGSWLLRATTEDGRLQDTGDNATDFTVMPTADVTGGGLYEVPKPIDVCANISGIQTRVPDGRVAAGNGDCLPDVCPNIEGLQETIPPGYIFGDGGCDIEALETATILITELLPNPSGDDSEGEYIELFNPNERPVNLNGYVVFVGSLYDKRFTIGADVTIMPQGYAVLRSQDYGFALVNTRGQAKVVAPANNLVSEAAPYGEAKEEAAWALIENEWIFTLKPTPGEANQRLVESLVPKEVAADVEGLVTVAPCPTGKQRNPATGRCRSVAVPAELVPCDEDEYRNPETNRCRSTATATVVSLVPCRTGQERSVATNRCRNILSGQAASELKPCQPGQERNPETNRCRKMVLAVTSNPSASTSPGTSKEAAIQPMFSEQSLQWYAVGLLGAGAVGYGVYEWRAEIISGLGRLSKSRR